MLDKKVKIYPELMFYTDDIAEKVYRFWCKKGRPENVTINFEINERSRVAEKFMLVGVWLGTAIINNAF